MMQMNSSADIKTVLKIGLLLPFHNNQTQAAILGGISGVRLAAVEINSLEIIPGAIVTLIEKDAYPTLNDTSDMAQAIFSTVSLLQQGVIGVIGDISSSWTALSALMTSTLQIPQCSFSVNPSSLAYKSEYFFRTAPTDLVYTNVILSFIMGQNWSSFGILNTDTDSSQHLTQALISKSKKFGMQIKSYQTFYDTGDTNNIHASIDTLMSFGSRVIVIATKEIDQIVTILTIAAQSGHIRHETVWITMANVQLELQSTISTFNRIVSSRSTADTTIPTFFKNAIEKTAWTTNVSSINYKTAFAGGIFTFESETNLTGYLPYDSFYQNKVETEHFNYHTGLAYSCLMTMAHGLGSIVHNSLNRNDTLDKLSTGQLLSNMSAFNQTGFVGPQGPILFDKHGDLTTGNFKIYNFQNGTQVEIGSVVGGNYTLSKSLVYFDGTSQPPSGTISVTVLTASLTTPISMATLFLSALGVTAAVIVLIILLLYRNEPVFKSANPLFCTLELIGFILSYIAIFLFFTYSYSLINCFMLPITFYISFSVILGTMISRNYSVYRIVNNVYASNHLALSSVHTTVKDTSQFNLFRLTAYILGINTFILTLWLTLAKIQLVETSVSSSISLRSCSYDGPGHSTFIILLSTVTGIELCLCIFLAFQTKSFGGYSKHSEHKQLGVSVYNIFFSALIGFIIFFMPTADYYTRHYLTAMTILWASTFSMSVLFFPKVYKLFVVAKDEDMLHDEPKSIDHVLDILGENSSTVYSGKQGTFLLDRYQETLPGQYIFRYFPYLARWQMLHIVHYPQVYYFSFSSVEKKRNTSSTVFGYSHATVESNISGSHVFRVHGSPGFYDLLIQVENEIELYKWCRQFKKRQLKRSNDNSNYIIDDEKTVKDSFTHHLSRE